MTHFVFHEHDGSVDVYDDRNDFPVGYDAAIDQLLELFAENVDNDDVDMDNHDCDGNDDDCDEPPDRGDPADWECDLAADDYERNLFREKK